MTTQRLHQAMAPLDILTREELEQELHKGIDAAIRERFRGIDLVRIPFYPLIATGATMQLFTSNDMTPFGPEQGDVWLLQRAVVKSNVLADTAKYVLFRGSTPSDVGNAYSTRFLLDGISAPSAGVTQPVPSQPAVPASTVAQQNVNSYPVQVVISGGTATSTSVNGVVVGGGDGTYVVPAYGSISVTYSVAPTWVWSNANANVAIGTLGQNVNVGFYPSKLGALLNSGEQVYAQISGATAGNQYYLEGEAIRCPAEMKGKLI